MINLGFLLAQYPATIDAEWKPGWRMRWSGFQQMWDRDVIAGFHIAYRTDRNDSYGYYASTQGHADRCWRGDYFDTTMRNGCGFAWMKFAELNPYQQGLYISDLMSKNLERLVEFMERDGAFDSPRMICEMSALGAQYHAPATEKVGDSWVCRPCRDRMYRSAAQRLTSKVDSVFTGTAADITMKVTGEAEVEVPRFMKCPRCGTNPARCEKPLTDEEKSCFSCGSELEPL